MNVSGLTSTLPSGEPQFTSVESLGGDRYLVVCEMLPIGASFKHQLAFVVEDTALAGETPHVTVLDCVSAAHRESYTLDWNELEALRTTYRVFSEEGQEALDVLGTPGGSVPNPLPHRSGRSDVARPGAGPGGRQTGA